MHFQVDKHINLQLTENGIHSNILPSKYMLMID